VKEFNDENGETWIATVASRPGTDYKGRFFFEMKPAEGDPEELVQLVDIRWNSEKTALRTLQTMSDVELRRRLRSARGRSTAL
jgi:hypothetical protein